MRYLQASMFACDMYTLAVLFCSVDKVMECFKKNQDSIKHNKGLKQSA